MVMWLDAFTSKAASRGTSALWLRLKRQARDMTWTRSGTTLPRLGWILSLPRPGGPATGLIRCCSLHRRSVLAACRL
jgi:hypothetical protein